MNQHRKYKRIYDDIMKNTSVIKGDTNSPFPSEDIMRHKPIIFMDNEKHIFQSTDWIKNYNLFTLTDNFDEIAVND